MDRVVWTGRFLWLESGCWRHCELFREYRTGWHDADWCFRRFCRRDFRVSGGFAAREQRSDGLSCRRFPLCRADRVFLQRVRDWQQVRPCRRDEGAALPGGGQWADYSLCRLDGPSRRMGIAFGRHSSQPPQAGDGCIFLDYSARCSRVQAWRRIESMPLRQGDWIRSVERQRRHRSGGNSACRRYRQSLGIPARGGDSRACQRRLHDARPFRRCDLAFHLVRRCRRESRSQRPSPCYRRIQFNGNPKGSQLCDVPRRRPSKGHRSKDVDSRISHHRTRRNHRARRHGHKLDDNC